MIGQTIIKFKHVFVRELFNNCQCITIIMKEAYWETIGVWNNDVYIFHLKVKKYETQFFYVCSAYEVRCPVSGIVGAVLFTKYFPTNKTMRQTAVVQF